MNKLDEKNEKNINYYRSKNNLQFKLWIKLFVWTAIPLVIGGCVLFALDYFVYTSVKVGSLSVYAFAAYIVIAFPFISNLAFLVIHTCRERKWYYKTYLDDGKHKGFHGKFLKEDDYDTTCDS